MDKIKIYLKEHNYRWRYKLIWCLPIFLVLVAFDWITKAVAVAKWNQNFDSDVIKGFLHFNFLVNFGSAYGANANNLALTIFMATSVTIVVGVILTFVRNRLWIHSANIFFAGAMGNLLARGWAPEFEGRKGGVVDFLSFNQDLFPSWVPTGVYAYSFNIADLCVNIAVVLLIVCFIYWIVVEVKQAPYKKHELIFDNWEITQTNRLALDQKLVTDLKQKSFKTQYFLYKEWNWMCKINELQFKKFLVEYQLQNLPGEHKNLSSLQVKKNQQIEKITKKLQD
ncbi:signal peptidase II [Spiroplasma clarkii]|uniref:signal peptidase II n=1 Tax=Spiroplasma clarkii TaxID=2139 RepID=UPI0011BA5219|nr:signal peptidase II [Spiroplasma clarkii]